MTYRCAIFGLEHIGIPSHPVPSIYCDGCGLQRTCLKPSGVPYAWLLNGKAPPGWRCESSEGGTRKDWCPRCKADEKGGAT